METITGLTLSSKMRRDAGVVGLLSASTTSVVGSGWLFGSYHPRYHRCRLASGLNDVR